MEGTIRTLHENNLNNPSNKSNAPVYPVTMAAAVQTSDGSTIEAQVSSLEDRTDLIEEKLDIGDVASDITIDEDFIAKFGDHENKIIDLSDKTYIKNITIGYLSYSGEYINYKVVPPKSLETWTDERPQAPIYLYNRDGLPNFITYTLRYFTQTDLDYLLVGEGQITCSLKGELFGTLELSGEDIIRLFWDCGRSHTLSGTVKSKDPIVIFSEYHRRLQGLDKAPNIFIQADNTGHELQSLVIGGSRFIEAPKDYNPIDYTYPVSVYLQNIIATPTDAWLTSPSVEVSIDGSDYSKMKSQGSIIDGAIDLDYPVIKTTHIGPMPWDNTYLYYADRFNIIRHDSWHSIMPTINFTLRIKIDDIESPLKTYTKFTPGEFHEPSVGDYVFADGDFDNEEDPGRTTIGRIISVDTDEKVAEIRSADDWKMTYNTTNIKYFRMWGPYTITYSEYVPDNVHIDDIPSRGFYAPYMNKSESKYSTIVESEVDMQCIKMLGSKYQEALEEVLKEQNIDKQTDKLMPGRFNTLLIMGLIKILSKEDGYNLEYPNTLETYLEGVKTLANSSNPDSALLYYPLITRIFLFDGLNYAVGDKTGSVIRLHDWETLNKQFGTGMWYLPTFLNLKEMSDQGVLDKSASYISAISGQSIYDGDAITSINYGYEITMSKKIDKGFRFYAITTLKYG